MNAHHFAPLALVLAGSLAACDDDGEPAPEVHERSEVQVLYGADPWLFDAREVLGALGEFEVEVWASSGTVSVTDDVVRFEPDPARYLTRSQLHVTGTGADGSRARVRFDIASMPEHLEYAHLLDESLTPSYPSTAIAFRGAAPADGFSDSVFDVGDFDANGYPDVLVAVPLANLPFVDQGALYLLEGSEDGVSGPHLIAEGEPGERLGLNPRVVDVDGDGTQDLVYDTQGDDGQRHAVVFGGDLQALEPRPFSLPPGVSSWDVSFADVDADGRADLLARLDGEFRWSIHLGTGDRAAPFRTTADASFGCDAPDFDFYGELRILGDLTADGASELAVICNNGPIEILDGVTRQTLAEVERGTWLRTIPDVDGDGRAELWIDEPSGDRYVALGLDSLTGDCRRRSRWPIDATNVKVVPDIDGDGMLELMGTYDELGEFEFSELEGIWLSGARTCAAQPIPQLPVDTIMHDSLIQDFDLDGRPELVSTHGFGNGAVFVQEFPGPPQPPQL